MEGLPIQTTLPGLSRNVETVLRLASTEISSFRDSSNYYDAQHPVVTTAKTDSVDEIEFLKIATKGLMDGLSETDAAQLVRKRVRLLSQILLVNAEAEVFHRNTVIKDAYLKKLGGYGGRHPLTAGAETGTAISAELRSCRDISRKIGQASSDLAHDDWKELIRDGKDALNKVNACTSRLSGHVLSWEKYIDDKRRLRWAVAGIFIGIALKASEMALHWLSPPPAQTTWLYSCKSNSDGQSFCQASESRQTSH